MKNEEGKNKEAKNEELKKSRWIEEMNEEAKKKWRSQEVQEWRSQEVKMNRRSQELKMNRRNEWRMKKARIKKPRMKN